MSKFTGYSQCPKCAERGADSRGDNAGNYADGSVHCFSCGYHKFPSFYTQVNTKDEETRTKDKAKLPNDFTWDVPSRAWKWLLQYGLPVSYWQAHCGYSEAEERLIIRVGDPLDFSLGRDVAVPGGEKPRRKWWAYGDCHKQTHVFGNIETANKVALVEDVISAHKVAYAGFVSIPLFGTALHDCHIRTLRHLGLPIHLWLDADQEGLSRKRAARIGAITGLPLQIITTSKDPKELPLQNIKELLT